MTPWRARATIAVIVQAAALASCVPATDEVDPRGAVRVVMHPSSAAAGEPFTTSDGWTLRFEKLALVAWVSATSTRGQTAGGSSPLTWSGAVQADAIIRALPVGPYGVKARLEGLYFSSTEPTSESAGAHYAIHGVDAALARRLLSPPDNAADSAEVSSLSGSGYRSGPGGVFIVRAEKGGRASTLDIALAPRVRWFDGKVMAVVRANDAVPADMTVAAERLFAITSGASLLFQPIADADRDGDGRLSPSELRAVRNADQKSCSPSIPGPDDGLDSAIDAPCATLLDRLAIAATKILVWR
jgi:hypothetical protein